MANPFNIHSNCYNGRLLVSLFIEVDNNQLSIQDYDFTQAPVLRHGNITITSDSLKKHLSAECLLLGVHDVARVKRGRTRPLFEVDFTNLTELRKFCKSLEEGTLQKKLHIRLQVDVPSSLQLQVKAELHLIVPHNGEWQLRSVTSSNCHECFSLISKSEVFKFTNFDLKTSILYSESLLSIDDHRTLFSDLIEVAASWFTIGSFLISHYALKAIRIEHSDRCSECLSAMLAKWLEGTEASPSRLVEALASTGMILLAKKVAGKFGISLAKDPSFTIHHDKARFSEAEAFSSSFIPIDVYKAGIQLVEQAPSLELALIDKRKELVANDAHYYELIQSQMEFQRKKEDVTKALADTKSTLGDLNCRTDKLKSQLETVAAKKKQKKAHQFWLSAQRKSKQHQEDFLLLNEMIEDTVTTINELSERMKELEETIAALESMADQLNDKLLRQQRERDSLQQTLDDLNKKIASAKEKLERDQMCHKEEIKRMLQEKKETDEKFQRQTIEIARQEGKIEEMRQDLEHRRDIDMALVSAGESPRTMTPIAVRKRNPDSGFYHDESSPTLVTKSSKCEIFSTEDEQRKSLSDLLATQKSNVNCLKVIVELRAVLRDIKSSCQLVTDHQVKCILLNIEDIYQFNEEILDSLQICVDNWRNWNSLSSILSRIVKNLEMYDTYFEGVKDAMLNLTKLMDNHKIVDSALKSFEKKQDLVLLHWMLEPLAILPKFCGKLEGYYKCLPSHSDDKAQAVKDALSDITEHFHQEGVRNMGSFAEILTIKRTLKNFQGTVLKPGRLFIKKGQLQKISRKVSTNRMFFLFSDVLFHTKPDGSQFAVRNEMPLQHMKVIEPEVSLYPHTFEVRSTKRSLILSASSEMEKMHWMECLNDAVRHHEQSSPSTDPNHDGFGCKAPVLVPDKSTVMCQLCSIKFTIRFRRHHCYACGIVVCEKCSPNEVYLEYAQKKMRVCFQCYRKSIAKGDIEMMLPQVLSPEAEDQDLLMRKEGESMMDGYVTVQEGLQEVRYWYVLTKDWTLKKYKAHEDIRAIVTIPLPGYVVTATIASNTIRLHHPTSDLQKIQITFKPVSGDYNDWVAKLEQATKLEEMTPVRRNSKSSLQNVEKSSVATSSSLLRSHTMPQTTSRKYATSRK